MLPLKDVNPTHRFPIMTYLLIVTNVLVFLWELRFSPDQLEVALTAWLLFRQLLRLIPLLWGPS